MSNLRERLKQIQRLKKNDIKKEEKTAIDDSALLKQGWKQCGYNVLKREINLSSPLKKIKNMPEVLPLIIPDLSLYKTMPQIRDFLFFDLETTGLSGGAGTVAFLAAFGRVVNEKLQITQYLLLDYPGENDFLDLVLTELKTENAVIVSYNGKCFDSQIIKTRCLMNRIKPPCYKHADLLHPARRLWKTIIMDCSQSSVETKILGLERINDIPGSLAPEIWFEFLKTNATERLIGICDHNLSDIKGLALILYVMIEIAKEPFKTNKYNYDLERLARTVYVYAYKQMMIENYKEPLELINIALKALEPGTLWYDKLMRRKKIIEKKIQNNLPRTTRTLTNP